MRGDVGNTGVIGVLTNDVDQGTFSNRADSIGRVLPRREHVGSPGRQRGQVVHKRLAGRAVQRYLTVLVPLAVDGHVAAAAAEMYLVGLEPAQLLRAQASVELWGGKTYGAALKPRACRRDAARSA